MTTTQDLVDQEKQAHIYPYSQLDAETSEQYNLLVELQRMDAEYNTIL